jgi:hypothetical protein
VKVTPETLTDEMIRGLLNEEASTTPVGPLWSTCVDALGDEWHEDDGRRAIEHNRERAAARQRICDAINARQAVRS